MTTYSDIKTRLFYDRDKTAKQRLRRKRSSGRLKQYNSEQDLRSWGTDQDDRRRHILDGMSGLKTLWGNYVPFETLFAQLRLMSTGQHPIPSTSTEPSAKRAGEPSTTPSTSQKPVLGKDPFSKYDYSQVAGRGLPQSGGAGAIPIAAFKAKELEAQKEDLSDLVKAMNKDANDLKRDSASVKSENENLRESVNLLEDQIKQLEDQIKEGQEAKEAKDNLENELKKGKEDAKELEEELENERRLSQELEDEKNQAKEEAEALAQQLEDERRKSAVIQEQLQNELEREKRKSSIAKDAAERLKDELEEEKSLGRSGSLKSEEPPKSEKSVSLRTEQPPYYEDERRASKELNDRLQRDLQDERRRSDATRDRVRELEKQLEDAARKDADDALEDKSALRRSLKMEQCLRNEVSSLENENDCLRKEIERLRMVECELTDCEIEKQDLLCEVESLKCCLERQEYEHQKMSCLIKEQQDLIFNLQDVVTSNKSNENLQSESWASCNESLVEYQCQIEDLNSTVAKQKSLISSQGECLQRQHNYITQLEQVRCKLQSQIEVYKNEIKEAKCEVDLLCTKRKQLQQELDFLTKKLESYLERIQGLEKSQLLNSKPCRQSSPMRSERSDRGSMSTYSTYSRDVCGGGSTSKCYPSPSMQPELDMSAGRSTANRQSTCRSRSCQSSSKKQFGFR
ncbi:cingulin-like protein 1 [Nilaparvata lugens]|uniref:cingulin-like protein 1 n=1 Tax=Nilaparvata lugens TaxID=108931 RepID=UPI00193DE93B|nr:cingulin-like protein 1 [Nilaparvata lugens]